MHDIPQRIADVLQEIENILRTSGRWGRDRPEKSALASIQPFCIDTLDFDQWLQWVFLPRMKQILELQQPLPSKSGIHPYAEESLDKNDPSTHQLLNLIKRFDELILIQSSARHH